MPDTTNLLDADGGAILYWWAKRPENGSGLSFAALRDEIVRQAREGMVPASELAAKAADHLAEYGRRVVAERLAEHYRLEYDGQKRSVARLTAKLAEAERKRETAKREGAREALTRAADDVGMQCGWNEYGDEGFSACLAHPQQLRKFRDRAYPAPAVADTGEREARRVTVQGVEFWHERTNVWPWVENSGGLVGKYPTLVEALAGANITPTADEYAALVAMGGGK